MEPSAAIIAWRTQLVEAASRKEGLNQLGASPEELKELLQLFGDQVRKGLISLHGEAYIPLVAPLTALVSLKIIPGIDNPFAVLRLAEKTRLTRLGVLNGGLALEDLAQLSQLSNLRALNVAHHRYGTVTDEIKRITTSTYGMAETEAIAKITSLTRLNFGSMFADLVEGQIALLANLPHLTSLNLHSLNGNSNALMEVTKLTRLQKLDVAFCRLDNVQVVALAALPQLTWLDATYNCGRMPPDFVATTSLRVLSLKHCSLLKTPPLSRLINLTELDYYGNDYTRDFLDQLSRLTSLRQLIFPQFIGIRQHLYDFLRHQTNLTSLSIGDIQVNEFAPLFPNIHFSK